MYSRKLINDKVEKLEPMELTPRGLQRRIKRYIKGEIVSFAAITVPGFERICCDEIERLQPGSVTIIEPGIVEFKGSIELLYNACLFIRTANRIVLRISSFTARSYPELFNKVSRIDWERYCGFNREISLSASSRCSRLHHSENIITTTFDAIQNRRMKLMVDSVLTKKTSINIFVRFFNDTCTISIDATGELLYKRGIRRATGKAPLRETTASALLYASSWERYDVIADPCCGSGGIIIEALNLSYNKAAGLHREFAFFSWPSFNATLWERVREKARGLSNEKSRHRLIANDVDSHAVALLERNLEALGESEKSSIEITGKSCFEFNRRSEYGKRGLLISNLPFGKRIALDKDETIDSFYQKTGKWLKAYCRGWNFSFLVADRFFERKIGLKCTTRLSFSNGGIPVRLVTGYVPE